MNPEYNQRNDIQATPATAPANPDGGAYRGPEGDEYRGQRAEYGERKTENGDRQADYGGRQADYSDGQADYGDRQADYGDQLAQRGDPAAGRFDAGQLREQWREVQHRFVDDPKDAVTRADGLVADALEQLTDRYSRRREELESQWARGDAADTEEMRQALRGYRELFDQLLGTASGATNM